MKAQKFEGLKDEKEDKKFKRKRVIKKARSYAMCKQLVKITKGREMGRENYIPLSTAVEKLGAGSGTACYFSLMKHMALIFGLCTITAIATMVLCTQFSFFYPDPTDMLLWITPSNIVKARWEESLDSNKVKFILIPELLFCILFFAGVKCMRSNLKDVEDQADNEFLSAGDYGMLVDGLPRDLKDAKRVVDHFEKLNAQVHSALLCYDVSKCGPNQAKLDEAVEEFRTAERAEDTSMANLTHFAKNYLTHEERIIDFSNHEGEEKQSGIIGKLLRLIGWKRDPISYRGTIQKLLKKRNKMGNPADNKNTGVAFVLFEYSKDMKDIAYRYTTESKYNIFGTLTNMTEELKFEGKYLLRVQSCVEPSDVKFENLGTGQAEVIIRTIILDLIALVFITAGVVIPHFFNELKTKNNDLILSLVLSLVVTVLSTAITMIIKMMAPFTKRRTQTLLVSSSIFRIWVADFLMGVFATWLFSIIDSKEVAYQDRMPESRSKYFMSYIWFEEVAINLLMVIIVDVAKVSIMQFTQIVGRVMRLPIIIFADKFTQHEVNKAFEPPAWPLEIRMAHMIKTVFVGMMISPFMPVVVPFLAVYFALQFWIDKFNLLRWYRAPAQYSFDMILTVCNYIEYAIHIHCISTIVSYVLLSYHSNPEENTFETYWFGYVFAICYGTFLLWRFIMWLYWGCKRGFIVKNKAQKDDEMDETFGQKFSKFEDVLQCYIDMHPCYNEPDVHTAKKIDGLDTTPIADYQYYSYYGKRKHVRPLKKKIACLNADGAEKYVDASNKAKVKRAMMTQRQRDKLDGKSTWRFNWFGIGVDDPDNDDNQEENVKFGCIDDVTFSAEPATTQDGRFVIGLDSYSVAYPTPPSADSSSSSSSSSSSYQTYENPAFIVAQTEAIPESSQPTYPIAPGSAYPIAPAEPIGAGPMIAEPVGTAPIMAEPVVSAPIMAEPAPVVESAPIASAEPVSAEQAAPATFLVAEAPATYPIASEITYPIAPVAASAAAPVEAYAVEPVTNGMVVASAVTYPTEPAVQSLHHPVEFDYPQPPPQ